MPCPNKDHHINCQCHKGGPVEPLYVDDDYIAFYFNMLAGIPEYDTIQNDLNDTIIECGGLEEACEKYPYVDMELCRDGIFRPVNGDMFSRYTNVFHIIRARRKYDRPEDENVPLTKQSIEAYNARNRALKEEEDRRKAAMHNQQIPPQPPIQQAPQRPTNDGFSFDLSTIVEDYEHIDPNEKPTYQQSDRVTGRLVNLANLVEGYEDYYDTNKTAQPVQSQRPAAGYTPEVAEMPAEQYPSYDPYDPNLDPRDMPVFSYREEDANTLFPPFPFPNMAFSAYAPAYPVQQEEQPRASKLENFEVEVHFGRKMAEEAAKAEPVKDEEVSFDGSKLVGEEDEKHVLTLTQDHADEFGTFEEDMAHAARVMHPNDPRRYVRQDIVDPRMMGAMMNGGVVPGTPYIGNGNPMMGTPTLPFKPTASYMQSMQMPQGPVDLNNIQLEEEPIVKSPMRLMMEKAGLKPKSIGELNASAIKKGLPLVSTVPPRPKMPGITTTAGGEECFSLSAFRRDKKQEAISPERAKLNAECEREKQEARARMKRLADPHNWKPNCPILKTPEFPDGIMQDHPEFDRVLAEMRAQNQAFSAMETGNAHAVTETVSEFDPADPSSYSKLMKGNEPTDKEVEDMFLESQFGERQRAYDAAKTDEERTAAMEGKFTSPLKTSVPEGVHVPGLNGTKTTYLGNNMNIPFTSGRYQYDDRDYMRRTPEDIANKKYPEISVVKVTKEELLAEEKAMNEAWTMCPGKSTPLKIYSAVVKVHVDENGMEWDEYIAGDKEAVSEEKRPAMDYKEASQYKGMLDADAEVYALAKELGRYNKVAADTLLWYKNNAAYCDFIEVKRESQEQLMEYRNADNLAAAKSTVIIAGDKTIVSDPKPITIEELEEMAKKESKKLEQPSDIDRVRSKYRNPVTQQLNAVMNDQSLAAKLLRIQALSNIRVINCADDKLMKSLEERDTKLSDIAKLEKQNYLFWKNMKWKAANEEQRKTFDEDFDQWWMLPRGGLQPRDESSRWKQYVEQRCMQDHIRFSNMTKNYVSPEQKEAMYYAYVEQLQRDFDQGTIRKNMTANELFEAFGYLETRMIERQIERQKQNVRRLYDPAAYLQEVRKHSALRNFQDGKGYVPTMDLMDQKVYYKKRQAFVNSIWEKANRGTIT